MYGTTKGIQEHTNSHTISHKVEKNKKMGERQKNIQKHDTEEEITSIVHVALDKKKKQKNKMK